jgi:predicted esterase
MATNECRSVYRPMPGRRAAANVTARLRRRALLWILAVTFAAAAPAADALPTGRLVEGVTCRKDPTQTYTLYLPSAYTTERRWPTLVIMDPRGRSVLAARLFRDAAETYGWILLSSNDIRSDGPPEPNFRAVNALLPDAAFRYATDRRRLYAAGFSGGAMLAWMVGTRTGTLAGVISSGGREMPATFSSATSFASFGTTGDMDFNYREMQHVDALFEGKGLPHRLEIFPGPHSWMPERLARQGVEWMELIAMKQGLRGRDDALIERLYAADVEAASELEAAGDLVAALRRYRAVTATFDGLRDVSQPRAAAKRMAGGRVVKAALKQERHWESYEDHYLDRMWKVLGTLEPRNAVPSSTRLMADLRLDELLQRAGKSGVEGVTARRLLESVFTRTSFYMTRGLFAAGRYADAETVLTVAAKIKNNRPDVWYNLACARARIGRTTDATTALRRAVECGYRDFAHMEGDADLASLHGEQGYQQIVARLRATSGR